VEVNFADPDDAVRERVRELGLSEAARDIDETIRASKVAGSNVADEVESHVRELVDGEDPSVFDAAPELADEGAATGEEDGDATESDSGADAQTAAEQAAADAEADGGTESDGSSTDDATTEDHESGAETRPEPDAGDGQSSMEEYL